MTMKSQAITPTTHLKVLAGTVLAGGLVFGGAAIAHATASNGVEDDLRTTSSGNSPGTAPADSVESNNNAAEPGWTTSFVDGTSTSGAPGTSVPEEAPITSSTSSR